MALLRATEALSQLALPPQRRLCPTRPIGHPRLHRQLAADVSQAYLRLGWLAVQDGTIEAKARASPGRVSDTQLGRSSPEQPLSEIVMKRLEPYAIDLGCGGRRRSRTVTEVAVGMQAAGPAGRAVW